VNSVFDEQEMQTIGEVNNYFFRKLQMTKKYHLAQVNIAKTIAPLDDPIMQGFVDQLDAVNHLAENSPGYIWRLKTEDGDATSIPFSDDERVIVNMSTWESLEALQNFVYSGDHLSVLRQKKNWFEKPTAPILALWWVPAGETPTIESAKRALQSLAQHGSSQQAFTFAKPFPEPVDKSEKDAQFI
jgi:hypothetical protein